MVSIKPGRGTSLSNAIGALFVGVFGVIWTIGAASMGAPTFFILFGVVFILFALAMAGTHLYNALGKKRFSVFDATKRGEEPDPVGSLLGYEERSTETDADEVNGPRQYPGAHCPFCGAKADANFDYCPSCGRDI